MFGRPTKYRPEFCDLVITLMSEGASKVEVCAKIGICYDTFQAWREKHSDFSESVKIGTQLCQAWWENNGRTNLQNKSFNYVGWYMNMKNRFGWKDKQEVKTEHSGSLKWEITIVDPDGEE